MEINLKDYTVTLKDEVSWGDSEQIQAVMTSSLKIDANARRKIENAGDDEKIDINEMSINGQAVLDSKVKAAELIIVKITDKTEKEIKFSRGWLFGLSKSDGNKVMDAVDKIRSESGDTEGK